MKYPSQEEKLLKAKEQVKKLEPGDMFYVPKEFDKFSGTYKVMHLGVYLDNSSNKYSSNLQYRFWAHKEKYTFMYVGPDRLESWLMNGYVEIIKKNTLNT